METVILFHRIPLVKKTRRRLDAIYRRFKYSHPKVCTCCKLVEIAFSLAFLCSIPLLMFLYVPIILMDNFCYWALSSFLTMFPILMDQPEDMLKELEDYFLDSRIGRKLSEITILTMESTYEIIRRVKNYFDSRLPLQAPNGHLDQPLDEDAFVNQLEDLRQRLVLPREHQPPAHPREPIDPLDLLSPERLSNYTFDMSELRPNWEQEERTKLVRLRPGDTTLTVLRVGGRPVQNIECPVI